MSVRLNWARFYKVLGNRGPTLLEGLDFVLVELLQDIAQGGDDFWSESLYELLYMGAAEDDLRQGVLDALEEWWCNVRNYLRNEMLLPESVVGAIHMNLDEVVIEELVKAASAEEG